ncbi:hypothetical protein RB195_025430 [Necator americanus]|uniref:Reverse transcriptase domain-containing protein n=1 Tax=Necator americanus TaxID=51031 RepID=A0ABR1ESF8_NECAM
MTRSGRLRMRRCSPTPALTIFVAYAPTSSYEEEEVEAFYMDLERSAPEELHIKPTPYNGMSRRGDFPSSSWRLRPPRGARNFKGRLLYAGRVSHPVEEALPSKVRHAIMPVTNRTALGPDRIRPEHLKNLPPVLINTLARLFTRYLSECKEAGFRKGFSTIDYNHTASKLIEVSREYKMPLCITFIDLKKAFDSVETEAVMEALDQGVPTQYTKVLRELYSNFTDLATLREYPH